MNYFFSLHNNCISTTIIPILEVRKLRFEEIMQVSQSNIAGYWESQDSLRSARMQSQSSYSLCPEKSFSERKEYIFFWIFVKRKLEDSFHKPLSSQEGISGLLGEVMLLVLVWITNNLKCTWFSFTWWWILAVCMFAPVGNSFTLCISQLQI